MKPKKNPKVSLERNRLIFFEVGAIAALSLTLLAFEWNTAIIQDQHSLFLLTENTDIYKEVILSTPSQKEKKQKPQIALIINEVDDNVEIEEPDFFNPESTGDEQFDLKFIEPDYEDDFIEKDTIFIVVEEMPRFNGGEPRIEFRKYIAANIYYPDEARENGIEGRVTVTFVIDQKGYLTDLEVIDSPHAVLSQAALDCIAGSPRWTPGKQRAQPVKVRFYFPVIFRLN